jgi:hypothetical protein
MKETIGYSDLIQFGIDPLAPDYLKQEKKFQIFGASGIWGKFSS